MTRSLGATLIGLVFLMATPTPAGANVCAFDQVPAATLLYPFVVFDYNNPVEGTTTLISITNLSPESQIVDVTLWTDLGVPLVSFNIVLSGFDVQTFNIRDVLYFGILPRTGTADSLVVAPNAESGARGPVSHENAPWVALDSGQGTETLFDRCPPTTLGYPNYPILPQGLLDELQEILAFSQVLPRYHDDCAGTTADTGDDWFMLRSEEQPTWMYITANVVWSCDRRLPSDLGYWQTPANGGRAQNQNVLTGDVIWIGAGYGAVDRAVHLEADPDLARVATLDPDGAPISFFYRYSTGAEDGADLREPLPTAWALRYLGYRSTDTIDSWIRVFKAPTFAPSPADVVVEGEPYQSTSITARDCLGYTYFAWDEDEQVITELVKWGPTEPYEPVNHFPLATQEVSVDQLDLPDEYGWVLFLWPPSNWTGSEQPLPDRYQTWMGMKAAAFGFFNGGTTGTVMANANCFSDQVLPGLGVDYHYVDQNGYTTSPAQ